MPVESARLLLRDVHLSQCAYQALKKALKPRQIFCASYKETVKAVEAMNIGSISGSCDDRQHCMCALTDLKETMQLIFAKQELVEQMKFPEPEQQKRLFKELYLKYPALYTNMVKHRPVKLDFFPSRKR